MRRHYPGKEVRREDDRMENVPRQRRVYCRNLKDSCLGAATLLRGEWNEADINGEGGSDYVVPSKTQKEVLISS